MYAPQGSFRVRGSLTLRRTRLALARGRRVRRTVSPDAGRYVRARVPAGKVRRLAIDATLRAAAPHQVRRRLENGVGPGRLYVAHPDLREKVLSRPAGVSLLFTVDASGSMGADEVMARTKGIVLSLLADAYQKRDRVGMISFRGTEARLALPFTASVERAQKRLNRLPTGGKSPLALALAKSLEIFEQEGRKNPGRTPLLVLLTDGKANISMGGADPFEEALCHARRIREKRIRCLIVDTDLTWIHSFAYARVLAEAMGAKCLGLRDLEVSQVVDFVNLVVQAGR